MKQVDGALMTQVAHLRSLTRLDLSFSNVDDTTVRSLSQIKTLRDLDLSHTNVTSGGLATIGVQERLESLAVLGLSMDAQAFRAMGSDRLRFLWIDGRGVDERIAAQIARFKNLELLSAIGTHLDDSGIALIASNYPRLRDLSLSGSRITDQSLETLARLRSLNRLDLSRTRISDAAVPYLLKMSELRLVDLSYTRMTVEAVKPLKTQRPLISIRYDGGG